MARLRSIKYEFWSSPQIVSVSIPARLLFIGLWNYADDNGVHVASISRLRIEVFPQDDIGDDAIRGMVDELLRAGLLATYIVGDEAFWCVSGWGKHQKIDRPTYRHPLPDGKIAKMDDAVRGKIAADSRAALVEVSRRIHSSNPLVESTRRIHSSRFLVESPRPPIEHGIIQADNTRDTHEPVLIGSIDTVARRGFPDCDLILIDEAHAVAGSKNFREVVFSNSGRHIIGLSATPFSIGLGKRYPELGGGALFEDLIVAAHIGDLIEQGCAVGRNRNSRRRRIQNTACPSRRTCSIASLPSPHPTRPGFLEDGACASPPLRDPRAGQTRDHRIHRDLLQSDSKAGPTRPSVARRFQSAVLCKTDGRLSPLDSMDCDRPQGAHRKKRERMPLPGMMIHQDGSRHAWVPDQMWDLVVTMDDATSEHYDMRFVEEEGTASSFLGMRTVILNRGLPCTFYSDRGSHYWTTPEAGGKVDKAHPTQFGRALRQLGIEMIPAYSPEARGRSERAFATHQDRLTRELALAGITDMTDANRYLAEVYRPQFNAEFAVPAREEGSAFVPWIGGNLDDILCEQIERTVGNDNCVKFAGLSLQIPADRHRCNYVKAQVRVHRYPDGRLAIFHGPRKLAHYTTEGEPITTELKQAA